MNSLRCNGMDERQHTAIHEAGHATANFRLGIHQQRVTIVPNDLMLGHVVASKYAADPVEAIKQVLGQCAGYAALVAAGHDEQEACAGADVDFTTAAGFIDDWSLPGTLEEWKNTAVEFMSTERNVDAAALVAEELLAHETLAGDYAEALIERADGLPWHIWRQYVESFHPDMLESVTP